MVPRIALIAAVALAALSSTGEAQAGTPTAKMAGQWDFSFMSPQGAMNWRVNFEQAGDTLGGQAQSEFGVLQLADAWVTGNELSFAVSLTYDGQPITVYFTGLVKGDTADGSLEVPNAGMEPIPFRAIRVAGAERGTPHRSDTRTTPAGRVLSADAPPGWLRRT